jgi:hypothetical protein
MKNPIHLAPEEARAMVLAALRANNYKGKTSELAQWTGLPSSVVRRAGLVLASKEKLDARLEPGKGKGEYLFTITQLDLFEDTPKSKSFWERVKSLFR